MRLGFRMGARGGRAVFGHNPMRKRPLLHPMNKARSDRASFSSFRNKRNLPGIYLCKTSTHDCGGSLPRDSVLPTPNLDKDGKLESEDIHQKNDVSGRHFLFDKTFTTLDRTRTRTVILPLLSDYYRSANLRPFGLTEGFPRSHAGRPFTLSYTKRFALKPSPGLPSLLVLNGKNLFSEKSFKPNRPKVNYSPHNPVTGKDNQKTLSYPDPMIGAPHSFIHRISELSSLQDDTVRQEKLKKIRRSRKPPS